jgi:uncharacterized protein YxeA
MRKKIIISLILILVLVVIAGGIWYGKNNRPQTVKNNQQESREQVKQNQNHQEETSASDWKTYKNNKYGFEMKYPNNWKMSENSGNNSDPSVASFVSPETQKLIEQKRIQTNCDLSVYYYNSIADEPENNNKLATIKEMIDNNQLITKIGTTKLGDKEAIDVVWGGYGSYYTILSENKGHLYKVFFCDKDSKDKLTATDKNILDSFRFLN